MENFKSSHIPKFFETIKILASCIPDCGGDERSRRAVNRRELPFVSLGHDVYAELPIQRRLQINENEIFIIDERTGQLGGKKIEDLIARVMSEDVGLY